MWVRLRAGVRVRARVRVRRACLVEVVGRLLRDVEDALELDLALGAEVRVREGLAEVLGQRLGWVRVGVRLGQRLGWVRVGVRLGQRLRAGGGWG